MKFMVKMRFFTNKISENIVNPNSPSMLGFARFPAAMRDTAVQWVLVDFYPVSFAFEPKLQRNSLYCYTISCHLLLFLRSSVDMKKMTLMSLENVRQAKAKQRRIVDIRIKNKILRRLPSPGSGERPEPRKPISDLCQKLILISEL